MDECPIDESLLARTTCILTYSGEVRDIWINYATLGLTLGVAVTRAATPTSVQARPETVMATGNVRWLVGCVVALTSVTLFQIVLCWILGCAGISIIWCSIAGWTIHERACGQDATGTSTTTGGTDGDPAESTLQRKNLEICEDIALTVVLIVLVYYAMTSPLITSVAHFCALLLGTILSRMLHRPVRGSSQQVYEALNDSNVSQS